MRISDWSSDVCSSDLLHEQAALPECLGKRREAERGIEILSRLDHVERRLALGLEQVADVIAEIARARGRDERIDIAPFLRSHIAEQVGADWAGFRLHRIAIFLVELDRKSTRLNSSH